MSGREPVEPSVLEDTGAGATPEFIPRMLKVTAAMGAGSVIVLALAAVRLKIVAVDLGPEGVGALTLLLSFVTLAALVLGLGLGSSATKEIAAAEAKGDRALRDRLRRALYRISLTQAVLGAAAVAILAAPIAEILGGPALVGKTRVAALAIAASIIGTAAYADLSAFRRIRALATIQPIAALIATAAAAAAWLAGADLLSVVILAPGIAAALLLLLSVRSLPPIGGTKSLMRLRPESRRLLTLGMAFLLNSALAALGALALRILINDQLDTAATGEFQAAFAIAGYYLSFVFAALATDYLPLVSGLADDEPRLNRAANSQLLVAVLITAPMVMILIAAASLVVPLLYSDAFEETPKLLRIMLLGELTRIAAWTLGYILVARTARVLFVTTELLYNVLLIGAAVALMPVLGLSGAALAYLICQVASLGWTVVFVRRVSNFALSHENLLNLGGYGSAAVAVYACATAGGPGIAGAWAVAIGVSILATRRLLRLLPEAPTAVRRLVAWTGWTGR